jgi:hypothetical protein
MPDAHLLPAGDATLAHLLAAWGYEVDERQRVRLTKRATNLRSEIDRVLKYPMAELRRLVGSQATQDELRNLLSTFFEQPSRA